MIDPATWLAFVAAAALIVVVPGPTVTLIVANALRSGPRAGLMNVAGTQAGLMVMIVILAVGLDAVVAQAGPVFGVLRLVGAAYLVWLGVRMWRSDGHLSDAAPAPRRSDRALFWQGVLVIWSNPKALIFFGAFIPQFVDPAGGAAAQVILLGATFMAVATLLDGAYALAAGRAGNLLSRTRLRLIERVSGTFLIGGGLWLALSRRV